MGGTTLVLRPAEAVPHHPPFGVLPPQEVGEGEILISLLRQIFPPYLGRRMIRPQGFLPYIHIIARQLFLPISHNRLDGNFQ